MRSRDVSSEPEWKCRTMWGGRCLTSRLLVSSPCCSKQDVFFPRNNHAWWDVCNFSWLYKKQPLHGADGRYFGRFRDGNFTLFFLGGLLFFCFFGEVMAVKGLKMCVHDQGGSRCRLEFASLHSLKMLPQECCSISAALVEVSQTVYD